MDDLRFYILFNSISVISGCSAGDNERLCAVQPYFYVEKISPQVGPKLRTARSVGQHLTHLATCAP